MSSTHEWSTLDRWSPRLFLAAGVLFVGHAVVRAIEAFTAVPPPVDVFGPAGYVAAALGLLGLAPAIVERTPRTGKFATGSAVVTGLGWVGIAGWSAGEAAGLLPPQTEILPGVVFAAVIAATLLTYLAFGVGSLRAGAHPRGLGLLLLAPIGVLAVLIVGGVLLSVAPTAGGTAIGGGMALVHWAIGGTLATTTASGHVAPTADAVTE